MELINKLLALIERGVVALETIASNGGAAGAGAASTTTTKETTSTKGAGKGKADKGASVPTAEETAAALTELREYIDSKGDKGIEHARNVMKSAAGVAKMAEIPEDKRVAVIKAAAAALEAYKAAEDSGEDM